MAPFSERQPASGGWVVLGMLMDAPRSGYDLAAMAARSVGQFWPLTKAHVYGELPRLERLGYVVGRQVARAGVPDKRVYSVTVEGRAAFASWIVKVGDLEPRQYHPLLLQLFFCARMAPGALTAAVAGYRKHAVERQRQFAAALERPEARTPDHASVEAWSLPGRQLVLRHEVSRLEAELAWLEEVEQMLGGRS